MIPRENIYGHRARLDWIRSWLRPDDRAVEFGCGTGYMVTRPLLVWGYDVNGIDTDAQSIAYGRDLLTEVGIDPAKLSTISLAEVTRGVDAFIASEVLEHLETDVLEASLSAMHSKLAAGGRLLLTVPNGYGWFELESALWFRTGVDRLFHRPTVNRIVCRSQAVLTGGYVDAAHLATVASSPHRQRFTWRSIQTRLEHHGFEVVEVRGSVLASGPFSHLALTGFSSVMSANRRLGTRFPRIASGFYIAACKCS